MTRRTRRVPSAAPGGEAFILAGGQSRRMGRDKARVRIGRSTMLALAKRAALDAGLPVRVIRKDAVPRCGPLGGVLTALRRCRAPVALFLACDMPFVSAGSLRRLLAAVRGSTRAAFGSDARGAGFPFALRRDTLAVVTAQVARGDFPLQSLAGVLAARRVRAAGPGEWSNINSLADLEFARKRKRSARGPATARRGLRGTLTKRRRQRTVAR